MQQKSLSCNHAGDSSILCQALQRKSASAASNVALFWGAINFVICAVLVASLWVAAGHMYYSHTANADIFCS